MTKSLGVSNLPIALLAQPERLVNSGKTISTSCYFPSLCLAVEYRTYCSRWNPGRVHVINLEELIKNRMSESFCIKGLLWHLFAPQLLIS